VCPTKRHRDAIFGAPIRAKLTVVRNVTGQEVLLVLLRKRRPRDAIIGAPVGPELKAVRGVTGHGALSALPVPVPAPTSPGEPEMPPQSRKIQRGHERLTPNLLLVPRRPREVQPKRRGLRPGISAKLPQWPFVPQIPGLRRLR
jgi:hypothetical protein